MKFYSEPVIGESFFAREDILALLLKSAKDIRQGYRHNIAITGRGLIGKSSLLLHFLNVIKDYNDLIPLYLNLRDINFPEFCSNFINAVLYHSLKGRIELSKAGDYN
jgi:AAA+ ATPase superfamily predicted ATPase